MAGMFDNRGYTGLGRVMVSYEFLRVQDDTSDEAQLAFFRLLVDWSGLTDQQVRDWLRGPMLPYYFLPALQRGWGHRDT